MIKSGDYTYIESSKIKVFPCAYRDHGIDAEARLNSERSLTHIGGIGNGTQNYIAGISGDANGAASMTLVLGGYTFTIEDADFSCFDDADEVYVSIKLDTYSITSEQQTYKLASWYTQSTGESSETENETLDILINDTKCFTGMAFTASLPDGVANTITMKLRDSNGFTRRNILPLKVVNGDGENSVVLNSTTTILNENATGSANTASGNCTIAEGYKTSAIGDYSHAEGFGAVANKNASHAEGSSTVANGEAAHAEGWKTQAIGDHSHAEGNGTRAYGIGAHAEGFIDADGDALGATGNYSHSEGINTNASDDYAHAEGKGTVAGGVAAHAEGVSAAAKADCSHAEGEDSAASGHAAHAEGKGTVADGITAHAEGCATTASGDYSHAEGYCTMAASESQHVAGKFNIIDEDDKYAEIIGGGDSETTRKNIRTLDWDGCETLGGSLAVNGGTNSHYTLDVNGSGYFKGKLYTASTGQYTDTTPTAASIYTDGGIYVGKSIKAGGALLVSGITNAGNLIVSGKIQASGAISGASTLSVVGATTIGTATSAASLTVNGETTSTAFYATSDARLKENVTPYKPEKSITDLPIYKYDFIAGEKNQIGCLAQDLQSICPEIVKEREDGYLTIEEGKLAYLLLEEIKKLKEEITEIKRELKNEERSNDR